MTLILRVCLFDVFQWAHCHFLIGDWGILILDKKL